MPSKKKNKEWSKGIDPLTTNLERSPTTRTSWGQVQPNKVETKIQPTDGLEGQHGTANMKPVVYNVGL